MGQALSISLARTGQSSYICVSDRKREGIINNNKSTCFNDLDFPDLISFSNFKNIKNFDLILYVQKVLELKI